MNREYTLEEVANIIPKGHENAIKLEQVVSIFNNYGWVGESDYRGARRIIERVGYEYTICNLQDGAGYFRPTKKDLMDFKKWIKQEEARISKVSKRLKIGRGLFEDFLKDRLEEQVIGNGK